MEFYSRALSTDPRKKWRKLGGIAAWETQTMSGNGVAEAGKEFLETKQEDKNIAYVEVTLCLYLTVKAKNHLRKQRTTLTKIMSIYCE